MKTVFVILALTAVISCTIKSSDGTTSPPVITNLPDSLCTPIAIIESAYTNQQSDISVTVKGVITKLLSDDTIGDNHQRIIVQLSNKQTILITHNIEIAPRVTGIRVGNTVYVHGDYVWNSQGGLIHWTHRDPDGIHENGWIVFGDKKFE